MDDVTRMNTKMGATAFNAPTKRVPKNVMPLYWGHIRARIAPMMTPVKMRIIRLLLNNLLKVLIMQLNLFFINMRDLLQKYNNFQM
jgi:hypothetical protein